MGGCRSETASLIVSVSPQSLLQWELKNNARSKRPKVPRIPRLALTSFLPIDGRVVQGRQILLMEMDDSCHLQNLTPSLRQGHDWTRLEPC
ncbi:hypothetical protein H9L39_04828 [Fusarium oxysporum f. sp. albedinis]|nr:hypothetical protein H9L39_04828 [Fusarium oxysporum f. sp. albedinis]